MLASLSIEHTLPLDSVHFLSLNFDAPIFESGFSSKFRETEYLRVIFLWMGEVNFLPELGLLTN